MLWFISKATKLSQEIQRTISTFLRFIIEKVSEAKGLLRKLYTVFDEDLAKVGIEDREIAAQTENKFIHCHLAFQWTKATTTTLN